MKAELLVVVVPLALLALGLFAVLAQEMMKKR